MLIQRATRTNRATLPLLVLAAVFGIIHVATVAPFLNEMAGEFGTSRELMGQLSTVTSLASVLAAISAVPFIERLSLRPVLVLGTVGLAATSVLTGLVSWFPGLLLVRFVAGIAAALVIGGCMAAVGRAWPDAAARAKRQGFVIAGMAGGAGLVAPLSRLIAGATGWQTAQIAVGAFIGLVAVAAWVLLPEMPGRPDDTPSPLRERLLAAMRVPRLPVIGPVLLLRLTSAAVVACLYAYLAGFIVDTYADAEHWIGPVFAAGSLAYAAAVILGGPLMARLGGPMRVSELGVVAQIGTAAVFLWVTPGLPITMLLYAAWGMAAGLYFNGQIAMLYEHGGREQSAVMFTDTTVSPVGAMLGAAVGGAAIASMGGFVGWQVTLMATCVAMLLPLPFVRRSARRQAARAAPPGTT